MFGGVITAVTGAKINPRAQRQRVLILFNLAGLNYIVFLVIFTLAAANASASRFCFFVVTPNNLDLMSAGVC